MALALKIAQARVFAAEEGVAPLLLIDDIFGELDPARRNRLLDSLPRDGQKLVTATALQWRETALEGPVFELRERQLHRADRICTWVCRGSWLLPEFLKHGKPTASPTTPNAQRARDPRRDLHAAACGERARGF